MNLRTFDTRKLAKVLAAVVVGLSVGAMVPPEAMAIPVVGQVSSLLVGGVGVVVGTVLYTKIPGSSDCGCAGDCEC